MTDRNTDRNALFKDLVADLTPSERPGRIGRSAVLWLAGSFIAATALMLARAPYRTGSGAQLLEYPQFSRRRMPASRTAAVSISPRSIS